ncbi:hypothetical protein CRUP_033131, partial [Coryphaenoides rupestris]
GFEGGLSTYCGDDPLEPWDRFVEYLGKKVTSDDAAGMKLVLERLVERFLHEERYANDIRYVKHCIKCASYYAEPIHLYAHIHSQGVGTRAAALYVAWAQQFERTGAPEQAEAVYQRALENQAQPPDTVLHEYSWSTRCPPTRSRQGTASISRSENLGVRSSAAGAGDGTQVISWYNKVALQCEGVELSFEEVRAARYFVKVRQEEERQEFDKQQRLPQAKHEEIEKLRHRLAALDQELGGPSAGAVKHNPAAATAMPPASWAPFSNQAPAFSFAHTSTSTQPQHPAQPAPGADLTGPLSALRPALKQSLAGPQATLAHPGLPPSLEEREEEEEEEDEEEEPRLDASQGATASFSHVTPNTSLGLAHATPSRVLPSPITREALDVIMDMFQAPTLLNDTSLGNGGTGAVYRRTGKCCATRQTSDVGAAPAPAPTSATPFTIFQDNGDQENLRQPTVAAENPPDESTMWGPRYDSQNSLVACPNSTREFAPSAQLVSTPFTSKAAHFADYYQDQENNCASALGDEENVYMRQPKKLSPIIEQSPSDETYSEAGGAPLRPQGPTDRGTILGEGVSLGAHSGLAVSCTTVVHPPLGALSFRDQTTLAQLARSPAPGTSAGPSAAAAGAWGVFTSPEQQPRPPRPLSPEPDPRVQEPMSQDTAAATTSSRMESYRAAVFGVPMSPECGQKPDWLVLRSPEVVMEPDLDLDVFMSPPRPPGGGGGEGGGARTTDVSMTPQTPAARGLAPTEEEEEEELMMSPDRGASACADVPMSPGSPGAAAAAVAVAGGGGHLVPDPWDAELIAGLLSGLSPPLGAHPHCITWRCSVPHIAPKTTITMGTASLRVDCLLGEGAFAKVYQASDPMTSEKMVLKVQKPANPWEFYVDTQLDARLPPAVRHLYSKVHSAHLFHNGSILLAELHRCGTLLNAVNLYKKLSERVMPQPLVMHFTICMLHLVEQLHAARLVHADVKPDNFLLGERFLESQCLDPEALEHGMVLVDLGQTIDMDLFPAGTRFMARCLTSGFQCTEMLSGRPWSYHTDYFGMAGTVYCMLFGTYMQVRQEGGVWTTNAVFRRNPHSELWLELFHTLLNIGPGGSVALPCLRTIRCKLTAVLRQTYGSKLLSLKKRLVVLLLEDLRSARR